VRRARGALLGAARGGAAGAAAGPCRGLRGAGSGASGGRYPRLRGVFVVLGRGACRRRVRGAPMTTMTPGAFFRDLFFETLRAPRTAARRLFALDLPMQVRWLALLLVSVLTLIAANIMLSTVPAAE